MICDNCVKKDVCIHLKNFLNLKFESNTVKIAIDECPHYCLRDDITFNEENTFKFPVCELCGEKCYEIFTCKKCGRKVCMDCADSFEVSDLKEDIECICYECGELEPEKKVEKSETDKIIDELF